MSTTDLTDLAKSVIFRLTLENEQLRQENAQLRELAQMVQEVKQEAEDG